MKASHGSLSGGLLKTISQETMHIVAREKGAWLLISYISDRQGTKIPVHTTAMREKLVGRIPVTSVSPPCTCTQSGVGKVPSGPVPSVRSSIPTRRSKPSDWGCRDQVRVCPG